MVAMADVKRKPATGPALKAKTLDTAPPHKAKVKPQDTSTWLTRNEVCDLLGISGNTIINLEKRGKLHAGRAIRTDREGCEREVYVYDPQEVSRVPRRDRFAMLREPGEIAARCFELLDQGKTVREIIIELRELPEKIKTLREEWLDAGGADFVISPQARATLEEHVGAFANVAELIERIEKLKAA